MRDAPVQFPPHQAFAHILRCKIPEFIASQIEAAEAVAFSSLFVFSPLCKPSEGIVRQVIVGHVEVYEGSVHVEADSHFRHVSNTIVGEAQGCQRRP